MKGKNRLTLTGVLPVSLSHVRREVWLVPLFALLTALGALMRVHLPGTPVPATLQTLFVLIAGGVGGVFVGLASQILYMALGFCGLPFFAGSAAFGTIALTPTLGYLVGFVLAAAFMGLAGRRKSSIWVWVLKGLAATAIIYVCGIAHLTIFTGGDISTAALMGAAPFIPWDVMKVIIAALVITGLNRRNR